MRVLIITAVVDVGKVRQGGDINVASRINLGGFNVIARGKNKIIGVVPVTIHDFFRKAGNKQIIAFILGRLVIFIFHKVYPNFRIGRVNDSSAVGGKLDIRREAVE